MMAGAARPVAHRLVLLAGLAAPGVDALAESDAEALIRLQRELTATIGEPVCGNVAFCRVMPMGADACGNPTTWVVYNNALEIKARIETRVAEITFLEQELLRNTPHPSTCERARQPKPACVNNHCVVGDTSY